LAAPERARGLVPPAVAFKSLAGGELKGITKNLITSRQEVTDLGGEEARLKDADAILAMRFDTSEMGGNWTEICANGTAHQVPQALVRHSVI
jgi:uncharacterized protein YbjQ (UPF0145 family)